MGGKRQTRSPAKYVLHGFIANPVRNVLKQMPTSRFRSVPRTSKFTLQTLFRLTPVFIPQSELFMHKGMYNLALRIILSPDVLARNT